MDKLTLSKSIVGKSFEYWKSLYDQGIINQHAIQLRLNHLKYALNHNLITNEEYNVLRLDITADQFYPSNTDYKPCSLLNFCKALKTHHLKDNLKINKPLIIDKAQKVIINTPENFKQQNGTIVTGHENHSIKEQENNNDQTIKPKKSKKKRKRKKKINIYDCTNIDHTITSKTVVTDNFKDKCDEKIDNSIVSSKNSVKIFNRQMNNKDKSQIDGKKSLVSTQRSVREKFSKLLQQFKKERLQIKMQC